MKKFQKDGVVLTASNEIQEDAFRSFGWTEVAEGNPPAAEKAPAVEAPVEEKPKKEAVKKARATKKK